MLHYTWLELRGHHKGQSLLDLDAALLFPPFPIILVSFPHFPSSAIVRCLVRNHKLIAHVCTISLLLTVLLSSVRLKQKCFHISDAALAETLTFMPSDGFD